MSDFYAAKTYGYLIIKRLHKGMVMFQRRDTPMLHKARDPLLRMVCCVCVYVCNVLWVKCIYVHTGDFKNFRDVFHWAHSLCAGVWVVIR